MSADRRKLKIPPWHLPYLEKHRIYELFHELSRELVIQQPPDHVLFLKQILESAARCRDVSRIVLLSTPKVNTIEVANQIARQTGQVVFTEESILKCFNKQKLARADLTAHQVAKCLCYLVRTGNAYHNGWIMTNVFKTPEDAKQLLSLGIIPTHVIHLIPPYDPPLDELLYCHVSENWPQHRRNIVGLRDAFKSKLMEIRLEKRKLEEVVEEIIGLVKVRPGIAPLKPRVLIIGPRGSGRNTQADMLKNHLGLVHVNFEYLLCQAWISESDLGEKLRSQHDQACFRSDILVEVLDRRILQEDCLESGYVLTGFPFTVMDFKYLDTLDTPPNRVIFLECDLNLCKEHIVQRTMNMDTGSYNDLTKQMEQLTKKRLAIHPLDKVNIVEAEHAYFCCHYGAMRTYCGGTAVVVNGDQPQRWVFENILAAIARAPQNCPPRNPYCDDEHTAASTSTGSYSPVASSTKADAFGSFVNQI